MKKVLLSLAAVAALAGSVAPAAAQSWGHGPNEFRSERPERLEWRIRQGERSGELSRREAYRLRSELRQTERLAARYSADGHVNHWERTQVDQRLTRIAMQLRHDRRDREYGAGYGRHW